MEPAQGSPEKEHGFPGTPVQRLLLEGYTTVHLLILILIVQLVDVLFGIPGPEEEDAAHSTWSLLTAMTHRNQG